MTKKLFLSGISLLIRTVRGGALLWAVFFVSWSCAEPEMIVNSRVSATDSHTGPVLDILYNENGSELISGGFDSNLMIWQGYQATLKSTIAGDYDKIFELEWIDSTTVASANYGGYITFWDVVKKRRGMKKRVHDDFVTSLDYDRQRGLLVSGAWDGSVKISRVEPFSPVAVCLKSAEPVVSVEVNSSQGRFYTAYLNGRIAEWDINDCQNPLRSGILHDGKITSMVLHPDGTRLVTLGENHIIQVFDLVSWKKGASLKGHNAVVVSGAFSADGSLLATGGRDNTIILWDFENAKKLYTIAAHTAEVSGLAFHPTGKYMASVSFDRLVKVWHIAGAKEKK